MSITSQDVKHLAAQCGFDLVGITPALPSEDFDRFESWTSSGFAGGMGYLLDHRGDLRRDPRHLLPEARSIICIGKLYKTPQETATAGREEGRLSNYASGKHDYHDVLRSGLSDLARRITFQEKVPISWRICVDTAPLLERSYARAAGLGWIGKNTCLINQAKGSWFFLGELLLSLSLAPDSPPADRCGSCRRCIEACPTQAIVPTATGWTIDSRLCISYLTIEERGPIPASLGKRMTNHIFGCDICQDVCPWNRRAEPTNDERFTGNETFPPRLDYLSKLGPEDFKSLFRKSPVWRAKYEGFLRNVATAMGNSGSAAMVEPLKRLASHPDQLVSSAAQQALSVLRLDPEVQCASDVLFS